MKVFYLAQVSSSKNCLHRFAFDPDVFENVEIGFKWDIQDDLSFTLSYFDSEQVQAVRDSVTGEASEVTA